MGNKAKEKLIVEERLDKPSSVSPMLFVGLGGCGSKIVARVSRLLKQHPDYEEKYKALTKFAAVDTNINDLENFRTDVDDTFLISDFEKAKYATLASGKDFLDPDPYFTQWVPGDYRFRAGDVAGAGQIRIESRLGCYYQMKHRDFVSRFRKLIDALKDHDLGHRRLSGGDIKIVVCYSVAGGTGSGAHLPIAYMLADQARQVGRCVTFGVAVLPSVFEKYTKENKDGTYANGYAALKETEYLMKLGAPDSPWFPNEGLQFHYDPSDTTKTRVFDKPFEFLYIVDKPKSMTIDNVQQTAADGLYLQFFSPIFGEQAGDYDNYTQHQRFLVPHDFVEKGIQGYSSFYGSYGAAVMLVPTGGLIEYCAGAAALSLIRRSFLGEPPAKAPYLNISRERFDTVKESDDENPAEFTVADIRSLEDADARDKMMDRLFKKRIRMLAAAEFEQNMKGGGRYSKVFLHGHRPGMRPDTEGGFKQVNDITESDDAAFSSDGFKRSIGNVFLSSFLGEKSSLEAFMKKALEKKADADDFGGWRKENTPHKVEEDQGALQGKLVTNALDMIQEGDPGKKVVAGLSRLEGLKLFNQDAVGVELISKRYATLCVVDEINASIGHLDDLAEKTVDLPKKADGEEPNKKYKEEEDWISARKKARGTAVRNAMIVARAELAKQLANKVLGDLKDFASTLRGGENGFPRLERDKYGDLEKLCREGDESANKYLLDVEALQITSKRRMWDFFYEDRFAGSDLFSLTDERVSGIFGNAFGQGASSKVSGEEKLKRLYAELKSHLKTVLIPELEGDPKAEDEKVRMGLTLDEALILEIEYWSIYESNQEEIDKGGAAKIRLLMNKYRASPPEEQVNPRSTRYADYLRNKFKRALEKAQYLCIYDDSKDMSGVRPNKVALGVCSKRFSGSNVMGVIKEGGDTGLKWLNDNWTNPREVILYQAVLNVPLYCFGRMDQYRNFYMQFKSRTLQSKSLHIDQNWENTILDLDPVVAVEEHERKVVREQITGFTALLSMSEGGDDGTPIIIREDGQFFLRIAPVLPPAERDPDREDRVVLGKTIMASVQQLPVVLEGDARLLDYRIALEKVQKGLAPRLLEKIAKLPREWRSTRDRLRNSYGPNTDDPAQMARVKDYDGAQKLLHEALMDLLKALRDAQVEISTVKGGATTSVKGMTAEAITACVTDAVRILERHDEEWQALDDPSSGTSVTSSAGWLQNLFTPVSDVETKTKNMAEGDTKAKG